MALRFQRRVSLFPGVRLNFSRSGVSATIGVRGASVTLGGPGGATANLGVPGTGLAWRQRLVPNRPPARSSRSAGRPLPAERPAGLSPASMGVAPQMSAIASASVDALTTPGLVGMRDLLLEAKRAMDQAAGETAAARRKQELAADDVRENQDTARRATGQIAEWRRSWFRLFHRRRIRQAESMIHDLARRLPALIDAEEAARDAVAQAEEDERAAAVQTEIALPGPADAAWRRVHEAFTTLSRSSAIWDVTAAREKGAGAERTAATRVIDRKTTRLSIGSLPVIASAHPPLRWHNANGHDIFLYPGFLVVFLSPARFALLGLDEAQIAFRPIQFIEAERPPPDAERVGTTWQYANKDGSRDRRYVHNPEVPILRYAEIHWRSATGLSEAFQFSSAKSAGAFVDALDAFLAVMRSGDPAL